MKTPNEYAQLAHQARQIARAIRPEDGNPCRVSLEEAGWHLDRAAAKLLLVAEYRAKEVDVDAAG